MKVRFEEDYHKMLAVRWRHQERGGVQRGGERERELGEKAQRPGNGEGWS